MPHPQPSTKAEPLPLVLGAAILALQEFVLELIRPITVPTLRVAIGLVYLWFGTEKILGLSPLSAVVVSVLPFSDPRAAVLGLGIVEAVLGLALIARLLVPWITAAQVLHLLGALAVLVLRPELAFAGGGVPSSTIYGDFIVKDVVLLAGVLVVAAHTHPRRAADRV